MDKKESKNYNEIYDVLQDIQGKKDVPPIFDENNYSCKSLYVDNDFNHNSTLNLTCDEGKILKYILRLCIKHNKINELLNSEKKSLNIENFLEIITSIKKSIEKSKLTSKSGSKSSKSNINRDVDMIVDSFINGVIGVGVVGVGVGVEVGLKVIDNVIDNATGFVKQQKKLIESGLKDTTQQIKSGVKDFKNITKGFVKQQKNRIESRVKDLKNTGKQAVKKKLNSGLNSLQKSLNKSLKSFFNGGAINVIEFITETIDSIINKIINIVRQYQSLRDKNNNFFMPINNICINGKKIIKTTEEKKERYTIQTKISIPQKCEVSNYSKFMIESKELFTKLDKQI
jgi:hypothetical protein